MTHASHHHQKRTRHSFVVFMIIGHFLCLLPTEDFAQVRKYPANISPVLGQPYTMFINDYSTVGGSALTANIVFNDFNEPSWTFKLRMKIESSNIRLETSANFIPSAPITLAPGVLATFSGADWEEYFNYNNLNITGSSVNELISNGGRLPEGLYSFCFQVLDYETGDPLSEEVCRTAMLRLMDPPRLNSPLCGSSIDPLLTQHIFSWQLFNAISPNAVYGNQYQLTVWEVADMTANTQTAVANGQALQIFQSPVLTTPQFAYGLAEPILEIGKRYVYRVQAIDPGGRDKFRNQGFSEFCEFYYGWPMGQISLLGPLDGGGFRKRNVPRISFSAVSPLIQNQRVNYEITIAPMLDGQTKEQAVQQNTPWYQGVQGPSSETYDRSAQFTHAPLAVMTKYAWQVKGFTQQQEVAKSPVWYFNGPPLMEDFWAGNHRVKVDYLDGSNLNDISGEGSVRLSRDNNLWTDVKFEHLQINQVGDFFIMTGGEFFHDPEGLALELPPDLKENGKAYFEVDRFRLNKDGLSAFGHVRWALPFAALSNGVATVTSKKLWATYDNYKVNTAAHVEEGNQFALLDPGNFKLSLSTASLIYVYEGVFRFQMRGTVEMPAQVKSSSNGNVSFAFQEAAQLFYIDQDSVVMDAFAPLPSSGLQVATRRYILDLSDTKSPDKFSADPRWKGVYLAEFDLLFNTSLDKKSQLDVVKLYRHPVVQSADRSLDAYIVSAGLDLKIDLTPDSVALKFQTFPALFDRFKLQVQSSQVSSDNSFLKGSLLLPVVSETKFFHFTVPVTNIGFQAGSLDDLINTSFTHNKGGGDQEMHITIKRAVLSANERIAMTLDVNWPSLGITLADLRGFNAWGDYNIGFDRKNGTVPLTQRYNATMSGYAVTMDVIGAGSNDGNYVFATTADAGLGDDVSGGEGAPTINIYSVVANAFVPVGGGGIGPSNVPVISLQQASQTVQDGYTTLGTELTQKMETDQNAILQNANDLKNGVAATFYGTVYAVEDIVQTDGQQVIGDSAALPPPVGGRYNSRQQEIVYQIAQGFVEELARPILDPIQHKTDSLNLAINNVVKGLVDQAEVRVQNAVEVIVKGVADGLKSALQNDKVDVSPYINEMATRTTIIVTAEIVSSLRVSTQTNICEPIRVLLAEEINGRIRKHIVDNGTQAVYAMLNGETDNAGAALEEIAAGAPGVLKDIVREVAAFVNPDHIRSTVDATASDFINNISVDAIGHDLRVAAQDVLNQALTEAVGSVVSNLAAQYAQDQGLAAFGGGGENPIDFVGVAQRFADGGIKGVFKVDKVRVKLRTPVIDLDGFMGYTPKHPVYGDVWLGDIDMTIKVPKKFAFNAIYFNGKKDGISYWFCQISPVESGGNKPYELGKPLPKTARPLQDPVNIGVAKIVAASGRLYHHMKETPSQGIVPDASMRYGAYMHFVFFDIKKEGKAMRLELSGEINSSENGDYTIAFDGNLQLQSEAPKPLTIDKMAAVQGTIMIRYNSAEEHFFGYATVKVDKPGKLCASGSLLVDVKPGKWRIAIGSREERIIFVPNCMGWSPTGWLDLNETTAELGLGIQYSAKPKTPPFFIGPYQCEIEVDAGIAAGIMVKIRYEPSLKLLEAGIWVDMWANVIAHYKLVINKNYKSITLVEIYIRGDLTMIFDPPPTILEGKLNGKVSIVGLSFNFKAEMRKEI